MDDDSEPFCWRLKQWLNDLQVIQQKYFGDDAKTDDNGINNNNGDNTINIPNEENDEKKGSQNGKTNDDDDDDDGPNDETQALKSSKKKQLSKQKTSNSNISKYEWLREYDIDGLYEILPALHKRINLIIKECKIKFEYIADLETSKQRYLLDDNVISTFNSYHAIQNGGIINKYQSQLITSDDVNSSYYSPSGGKHTYNNKSSARTRITDPNSTKNQYVRYSLMSNYDLLKKYLTWHHAEHFLFVFQQVGITSLRDLSRSKYQNFDAKYKLWIKILNTQRAATSNNINSEETSMSKSDNNLSMNLNMNMMTDSMYFTDIDMIRMFKVIDYAKYGIFEFKCLIEEDESFGGVGLRWLHHRICYENRKLLSKYNKDVLNNYIYHKNGSLNNYAHSGGYNYHQYNYNWSNGNPVNNHNAPAASSNSSDPKPHSNSISSVSLHGTGAHGNENSGNNSNPNQNISLSEGRRHNNSRSKIKDISENGNQDQKNASIQSPKHGHHNNSHSNSRRGSVASDISTAGHRELSSCFFFFRFFVFLVCCI